MRLLLLLVCILLHTYAQALQWQQINPPVAVDTIGVAYDGKDTYVMIQHVIPGYFSAYYTNDPSYWNPTNLVGSYGGQLNAVTLMYINDSFLIFTNNTRYSSSNGSTFESDTMNVAVGEVQYVVDNSALSFISAMRSYILISKDGITWERVSYPGPRENQSGLWVLGNFLLYEYFEFSNNYLVSTDAQNWTQWDYSRFGNLSGFVVSIGETKPGELLAFITEGQTEVFDVSHDAGETWEVIFQASTHSFSPYALPVYNNGIYSYVSYYGLFYSTDLSNWTKATDYTGPLYVSLAALGEYLFLLANTIVYTSDYKTFNEPNNRAVAYFQHIYVTNQSEFVLLSSSQTIQFYSLNSENWTFTQLPYSPVQQPAYIADQIEANGMFYFLYSYMNTNTIYSTSDFITWNKEVTTMPSSAKKIFYQNGAWLALTMDVINYDFIVKIYRSSTLDGTWDVVYAPVGNFSGPQAIAYTNNIFAVLFTTHICWSSDGIKWTLTQLKPNMFYLENIYSAGKLFYLFVNTGTSNVIYYSADAQNWQQVSIPITNPTIMYDELLALYFAYGNSNYWGKVAASQDGITWEISDEYSVPTLQSVIQLAYSGKFLIAIDTNAEVQICTQ